MDAPRFHLCPCYLLPLPPFKKWQRSVWFFCFPNFGAAFSLYDVSPEISNCTLCKKRPLFSYKEGSYVIFDILEYAINICNWRLFWFELLCFEFLCFVCFALIYSALLCLCLVFLVAFWLLYSTGSDAPKLPWCTMSGQGIVLSHDAVNCMDDRRVPRSVYLAMDETLSASARDKPMSKLDCCNISVPKKKNQCIVRECSHCAYPPFFFGFSRQRASHMKTNMHVRQMCII